MKHVLKEQPMLLVFVTVCVHETRDEISAHVGNFSLGLY